LRPQEPKQKLTTQYGSAYSWFIMEEGGAAAARRRATTAKIDALEEKSMLLDKE